MTSASSLYKAGTIGTLRLKNRLIMSAMGVPLADAEGLMSDKMIAFYRARAEGGVSLVVTSFAAVSPDATFPLMLGIYDDRFIPGFSKLADAIHDAGAKLCVQLMHPGMLLLYAGWIPEGVSVKVPSMTPWLQENIAHQELGRDDIDRYVELFADAARRVKESGADAVELNASNGSLLSTFFSPVTNRRTDEYGGSVENRGRFARRVVERIRETIGSQFPVSVKINMHDDMEGGVTPDEVVRQAQGMESAGVDAINVGSGLQFWTASCIPCYLFPDGPMVPMIERVKKAVRVPVIAGGKISLELAGQILTAGKADFVAMGRPLLADPELPNKVHRGQLNEVWKCIYCNNCINGDMDLFPGACSVNPFLFREGSGPLVKTEAPKRVMVIGGGLAGMWIAWLLARRGHRVSLHEKSPGLGGQWTTASASSAKKDHASLKEHLERCLREEGVSVVLGVEVTREGVLEVKPDVVVVATGATPASLDVPGADGKNVVQGDDVIAGRASVKGRAVVIGGRFVGMEVAIYLSEQGKQVSLVTQAGLGQNGIKLESMTHRALTRRLIDLRVPLYLHSRVIEITDKGVVMTVGNDILSLPADTVILAVGVRPNDKLARDLEGVVPKLYKLGDCVKPKDAASAAMRAGKLARAV